MSAAPKKTLVVCGGTGFLGSRIARAATQRPNWRVISLSRSGVPHWPSISASSTAPGWASGVSWEKADLLQPGSYEQFLEGADAVVHSMGILLEADYKGVLQGRESPVAGLRRAFAAVKGGSRRDPLERREGEGDGGRLESGEGDGQVTYELMNRDSAIALAKEAAAKNVKTFVFISAAGGAPVLPTRYITTKREAESTISSQFPSMRNIFPRPGFLYDSSRLFTVPLAYSTFPIAMFNSMIGRRLSPLLGAAVEKPLKVDTVADAVMEAIEDETRKGPIQTEEIEELATKAWRKGML